MHYVSRARLLGLPLVQIHTGEIVDGRPRRGLARAWIAIGDVACGVLFAAGGIAIGGVSLGGLALGVLPIGGLALGGLAVGGAAAGVWAVGGAAFGLHAALGGLAVAGTWAAGGAAVAAHANDVAARAWFAERAFFRAVEGALAWSWLLVALPTLLGLGRLLRRGPTPGSG
jgi:hypothetical protein